MFEIYQSDRTKKFHFRLKAANYEIILTGQSYKAKADCLGGVVSVRKHAADVGAFEIKESSNGHCYFTLRAGNGQVIGQSQMYKSRSGLHKGIASVQKNATDAVLADLTA